jgi:glycosyltransferase involved in cell wall biosynthesis
MMGKASHLKVLHIASGDLWAGAEVQLFTLAKALHSMSGVTVEVIVLNHGRLEQELQKTGVKVMIIDEAKFNGIIIFFRIISAIIKTRPDVIHTHRIKENILGSIAAFISGNIPSLRTVHGASEHKPQWQNIPKRLILFFDWLCGRFLQKKIIAVSEDLAGILQKDFPVDRIIVIENGIDTTSLTRTLKREISGIKPAKAPYRIGIVGRLVPVKRIDLFIQAAAELHKHHPELNISFHIYGDGPLLIDLITLNQKLGTDKLIHFEGHCDNMHQEMANLDVLLITSDHEGLPMILLEAMALQTPIIAHAVGGIPKVLDHGKCGILVSDQQPSAYSTEIIKLITNPEIRINFIRNAYYRVTLVYSSKNNASEYYTVYKNLAAQ